MLAIYNNCR